MVINNRLAALAAAVGAALVLVGCSTPGRPTSSGTTSAAQPASPSSQITPTSGAPASGDPRRTGKADGLQITIYPQEGGMDCMPQALVPPCDVKPRGQVATYEPEMQLDAKQDFTVSKGDGAINVTRTDVATQNPIGTSPTASLRISVEP